MRLILASNSPRRRDLLELLSDDFAVVPSFADESATGVPSERAIDAARAKVNAVARDVSGVVIGADTIVVIDAQILGKPRTCSDARKMLETLSGRTHRVLTGVCILNTETRQERTHCEETRVTFRALRDREIDAYLDTGEYHDKAGAYAIQGKAMKFISKIEGDYANVMGLPLYCLISMLRELGVDL